ncbi:MAG TPA: glycosyltransferase family 39 protein [Blastocatellia bacterium]|nr:glycosyltransferase family 39 protein [Blastocatellia bacterium]
MRLAAMQGTTSRATVEGRGVSRAERLKGVLFALAVLAITASLFGFLFNRESVLSYSIGYNLYGAERVLDGETPYRDFHTLYPPATLYLNAAIFKLFGITLYNALLGVFVFKVLTALALYLCGAKIMARNWALLAALSSLIWLRPNGPFKAVPMHYGALFLALALFLLLKSLSDKKSGWLFLAGISLGALTLFKHNIGGYALTGTLVIVLLDDGAGSFKLVEIARNYKRALALVAGFLLPVAPVLIYMAARGALLPMMKTLLFGPGEFLVSRLASAPSPLVPALFVSWIALVAYSVHRFRSSAFLIASVELFFPMTIILFLNRVDQSVIDKIIFYAPVIVILAAALTVFKRRKIGITDCRALALVTVFAWAAFMESFPRFAREQAIAAMPFVILLLCYLLYVYKPLLEGLSLRPVLLRMAFLILPMAFVLMGGRLFYHTYFDGGLRLKSTTELAIDRGRGVYFPAAEAEEIDRVVSYIQENTPQGGHFFPQSYAGSSFLFLADRENPSGAQFWGGVGVTDDERADTLKAIDEKHVELIVTSDKDVAAEKHAPMRELISGEFETAERYGDVLILRRKNSLKGFIDR